MQVSDENRIDFQAKPDKCTAYTAISKNMEYMENLFPKKILSKINK